MKTDSGEQTPPTTCTRRHLVNQVYTFVLYCKPDTRIESV